MKQVTKQLLIELCILFFLALVPLVWMQPGEMMLGHDTGIRLNNLDHFKNLFFSWDAGTNMGRDLTIAKGFLITKIPETLFYTLTHSFGIAQPLTYITWLLIMEGCMYGALRTLFSKPDQWFIRLWGTTLFVYNFFILQAWTIVERAKFSAYAALPLLFLFLYQGMTGARSIWSTALTIGITVLFLNGGSSPPLFGGILITLGVTALVMTLWNADSMGFVKSIKRTLGVSFLSLVVTIALNAYWILPQVHLYTTSYADALAGQGGTEGILSWEAQVSKDASLFNLIRLQGVPGMSNFTQYPFMHAFSQNPFLVAWSFLPILSILLSVFLIWYKQPKTRGLLVTLSGTLLLGIIFTGGSHPPLGFIYTFFVNHVPGFSIFRSSFLKFAPALWFSVTLLSGFALWQFTELFKHNALRAGSRVALFFLLLGSTYPFVTSQFFTWNPPFTIKLSVPSYVTETTTHLQQTIPQTERVLLLPPFDEQTHADSYQWGYWSLNTLPGSAFSGSVVANDAHNPPAIVRDIYEALKAEDTQTATTLLHRAGTTHILWRDDILWADKKTKANTFSALKAALTSLPFKKTYSNGPWSVYTADAKAVPLVHTVSNVALIYGKRLRISTFAQNLPDTTAVVFSPPPVDQAMQPFIHQELVGSACIYCRASDREAFADALHVVPPKILPGTLLYPLVMWRENSQWRKARTDTQQIDALLAFANRRLAELSKLASGSPMRENRLVAYQKTVDETMKTFERLEGLDTSNYAVRIALYFSAQQQYIQETQLRLPQPLLQKLTDNQTFLHTYWRTNDEKTHTIQLQFHTQKQGMYRIIPPFTLQKEATLFVDGKPAPTTLRMELDSAVHTLTIQYAKPHPEYDIPIIRVERDEAFTPLASQAVSFSRINPTLVRVSLPKRDTPLLLVFRDAYHPEWLLTSYEDKAIGKTHFMVDGYANGWIIPAGPALEATISYYPQHIFYIGLGISIISLSIVLVLLCFHRIKPKP